MTLIPVKISIFVTLPLFIYEYVFIDVTSFFVCTKFTWYMLTCIKVYKVTQL